LDLANESDRGGVGIQIDVGEATLELCPEPVDRVTATSASKQSDEAAVDLFGDRVEVDGSFQDLDCGVGLPCLLVQFGEPDVGVESATVKLFTNGLNPQVVRRAGEPAAVEVDYVAERGAGPALVSGCLVERVLEAP
jgi:hypothetical protein